MRTPIRLPEKTKRAILADYERIMAAVLPWVGRNQPRRLDRHEAIWRPLDGRVRQWLDRDSKADAQIASEARRLAPEGRPPRSAPQSNAWREWSRLDPEKRRAPGARARLGGRAPDAATWTAIDLLAMLYQEHTGRKPGTGATGPFIDLVDEALHRKTDVRKLIRQVLAARREALRPKTHSSGL